MKWLVFIYACVVVMLRRSLQRNDWRVLLVLFIIMTVLSSVYITFCSFVLTLAVIAVYDIEAHADIKKEFQDFYDDRLKKF